MKKIAIILFSLLFVVSIVFGADSDLTLERIQKSRMLKSAFSTIGQEQKVSVEERAIPGMDRRAHIGKMHPGKMHLGKTGNESIQSQKWVMPKKLFQGGKNSLSSGLLKASQFEESDTLVIDFIETDTIQYIPGDIIVFQIVSFDSVLIEPYVDNGDGIFNSDTDLLVEGPDMEEEIWIVDGDEDDETPPGDGVWQVTFNTGGLEEGNFFGLQGMTLFISATEKTSQNQGLGVCCIERPDENTSISGSVMIEGDPMVPAADMIVLAFQKNWFGDGDNGSPDVGFTTMTDDTGYYLIEIPDTLRGEFVVFAFDFWNFYPGYFADPEMMTLPVMGDIPDVNFVLREASETIYGYVTDENDNPVPDIRVYANTGPHYVEDTTDVSGYYVLPVFPGWWRVEVEEDDLIGDYMIPNEQHLEVFEDGDHPADFILYSVDGYIEGTVTYQDGNPAQGIEVEAGIYLGWEEGEYWTYSETDEFGNYTLMVSKALQGREIWDNGYDSTYSWITSYWVSIWEEDDIVVPREYWDIFADTTGLDFTIYMSDAMLSGYIYDSVTDFPLGEAGIHAFSKDSTDGAVPPMDVWDWTEGDGYYELPLIGGAPPDGKLWNIEVFWPHAWIPSVVDTLIVFSGNNYTQDYYIKPPVMQGLVEGYVYDKDGIGINNARVELYGPDYFETWTDEGGYFRIEDLRFGWYNATAYAPDYEPNTIYDIWVGPEPVWLKFWMGSAVGNIFVNGVVTDAATNNSIPGALVFALGEFWMAVSGTDSTGYYEFWLKPGFYDFQAGANGFLADYLEGVEINQDTTINFELGYATIADTAKGSVVDDVGIPLRNVFIYWESDPYPPTYIGYTYTDFDGKYEIGLPSGDYNVMFWKEGFNDEYRWLENFPTNQLEDPVVMWPHTWVFGPEIKSVGDVPDDHGKQVRLTWERAEGLEGTVMEYLIWRAIEPPSGPDPNPDQYHPNWDYVASVSVHPAMGMYHYVAPTLYDKVGDEIRWTAFMVTAIGWDGWSYWDSNIKAGFSEDNLPPETPTSLTGSLSEGSVALFWEEVVNEPVQYYTIYRRLENEQFVPIGYSTEPEYSDTELIGSEVYYAVSATDYGLNESPKSSEISVTITAIDGGIEIPDEFALKPNYPNPFNPETTIEFALPENSKVTLTVYNLKGQFIRELVRSEYNAGYQRVVWDARDQYGNAVGSGVYIYTIKADNFTQTRKMVLLR